MTQTDRVVRMLTQMQRDIRDLQLAPRLGNSSLEGGINNYDPTTGALVGRVGNQFDGTYGYGYFTGPRPPQPTKPIVVPCPGGLTVTWDGGFTPDPDTGEPRYVPMDFTRVEVHVGEVSGFYDRSAISLRGTIETPRGGDCQVIPLAIETKYVVLVARTASGADSLPSEEVSATPGSWVTEAEVVAIQTDLDSAKTTLTTARTDIATLNTNLATTNAGLAATFNLATNAQTTANGKGRAWFQTSPPSATSSYDVWFDTDDDNKPYRPDGSGGWVAQPFGNAAIGNLDAGKISTGYLAAARILVGSLSGDKLTANTVYGDRLVGNSITGDKITGLTITGDKIVGNAITGDKIMANEIVGVHIRSREIGADHIAVGAINADHLQANSVTAAKVDAYAITSKVVTGGTFRTGLPGDDRIEIIDQVGYDSYLGYYRSLRDTVRWVRGYDGALVGEIRGYMGDIGAYGLHLNSDVEIGNLQSTIRQVGKRKAKNGATQADRVRAKHDFFYVSGGGGSVAFDGPLSQAPSFVVATLSTGSVDDFVTWRVRDLNQYGFFIDVRYVSSDPAKNGQAPGNGTWFYISYYAEIVV